MSFTPLVSSFPLPMTLPPLPPPLSPYVSRPQYPHRSLPLSPHHSLPPPLSPLSLYVSLPLSPHPCFPSPSCHPSLPGGISEDQREAVSTDLSKAHCSLRELSPALGERQHLGSERSPGGSARQVQCQLVGIWTMKTAFTLLVPLLLLLVCEVNGQPRKPKPTKVKPARKPTRAPPEPVEPTDLPPPLPPGPPSVFADCPRECFCPPDFPSAIYCDSRNLRKVPPIPSRTRYLYLQNNFIDDLQEDSFKNATELRWINLDNNRIKKVEKQILEKMDNLTFLYMERNQLKELPAFLPAGLEQLRLSNNQISKIPAGVFSNLENLLLLDLHRNKLSDGIFNKNTFKGLKNLMQLNLAHNILRKMPAGVPNSVHQLFLDKNNIEDIPSDYFKDFPNLTFVRLNYNQLSDKGMPKNVFNISNLLVLQLSHNRLASVPPISAKLEHLYLNDNVIEKINGTEICPTIMSFDVYSEPEKGPRLRYLRLDGNQLKPPIPLDLMLCFRLLQSVVI